VVHKDSFKMHYEIGGDKRPLCIETCFLEKDKYTLLIFKKGRSCTDKLHIKWIRLNGGNEPHVNQRKYTYSMGNRKIHKVELGLFQKV